MKIAICSGPPTTGKTSVLRHSIRKLLDKGETVAFLKIDVQFAEEDELLAAEFGIPTRKVYSGELCPDHCSVMVLGDAIEWADQNDCSILLVETAGLCLRCAPVRGRRPRHLRARGHQRHEPAAQGRPHALAGRRHRGHQGRPRVARPSARCSAPASRTSRPMTQIREANALYGIGIDPLVEAILETPDAQEDLLLRGSPPVGTCTICVGKKEVGWQAHFGVVRALDNQNFYRGQ